jgi:demethylmenaquinone methyltransferase / 2-methoxy-6-polyprenyl-1,4-benzoquinol methylase
MDRAVAVSTSKDPARIAGMFDAIAARYDFLNHALSAGLDRRWRRRAIRELALTGRERLVDVCTGTGDLAVEAATHAQGRAREVVGLDFAGAMVRLGVDKVRRLGLDSQIRLARADAMRLPLADASCDAATVAFGIRNVADPLLACREIARVLRPGGRLAILEFAMPTMPGVAGLYRWYFERVLPGIGRLVSRHDEAYAYLPASVGDFATPLEFADGLRASGFESVRAVSLTAGVVYLYVAVRA